MVGVEAACCADRAESSPDKRSPRRMSDSPVCCLCRNKKAPPATASNRSIVGTTALSREPECDRSSQPSEEYVPSMAGLGEYEKGRLCVGRGGVIGGALTRRQPSERLTLQQESRGPGTQLISFGRSSMECGPRRRDGRHRHLRNRRSHWRGSRSAPACGHDLASVRVDCTVDRGGGTGSIGTLRSPLEPLLARQRASPVPRALDPA